MYVATIYVSRDDESADAKVVADDLETIHAKITKVKDFIKKYNLRFVGSIITEMHGVHTTDKQIVDLLFKDDKITH